MTITFNHYIVLCHFTDTVLNFSISHLWWPRFTPQLWMLPVISVILAFYQAASKKIILYTWMLTGLLIANGIIVLVVHMNWETRSSITFRIQLTTLQLNQTPILIDYGWFKKSMEEKLTRWNIEYQSAPRKELKKASPDTLTSVVEGYPNMILFKKIEKQAN